MTERLLMLAQSHLKDSPNDYAALCREIASQVGGLPWTLQIAGVAAGGGGFVDRLMGSDFVDRGLVALVENWTAKRRKPQALTTAPSRIEPAPPVADTSPPEPQAKPLQRQQAQETAILEALGKLGYDPLSLPCNKPGKSGAKAAVRDDLRANRKDLFYGTTVFDKAWLRLSGRREIVIKA